MKGEDIELDEEDIGLFEIASYAIEGLGRYLRGEPTEKGYSKIRRFSRELHRLSKVERDSNSDYIFVEAIWPDEEELEKITSREVSEGIENLAKKLDRIKIKKLSKSKIRLLIEECTCIEEGLGYWRFKNNRAYPMAPVPKNNKP